MRIYLWMNFAGLFFRCTQTKASWPDGLSPGFFQHFLSQMGLDIFSFYSQWSESGVFHSSLMATNIVLIPKCHNPSFIRDFRLISMCNM